MVELEGTTNLPFPSEVTHGRQHGLQGLMVSRTAAPVKAKSSVPSENGSFLPAGLGVPGPGLPKQHRALHAPPAASFHHPCLLPGMVAKHNLTSWVFCKLPGDREQQAWAGSS